MPTYRVAIDIAAPPETVYAYIADLTRHSEWSADPLAISAVSPGPATVGSRYTSTAQAQGRTITAELEVTELQPPQRFAFSVRDLTGTYRHQFSVQPAASGSHVERVIGASLSLPQALLFYAVFLIIKRPNTRKGLERLKARLETPA
jgi:uncharacterized protein YndB with AHSA1/START domain